MAVDILTKPGMENWRGGVNLGFRDDALNARNAMAPRKVDEQQKRGGFTLDGPLWRKHTSLSLNIDGFSAWDTQTIRAVAPPGELTGAFRRPTDRTSFDARVEHALTKTQVLRVEFQRRGQRPTALASATSTCCHGRTAVTTPTRRSASRPMARCRRSCSTTCACRSAGSTPTQCRSRPSPPSACPARSTPAAPTSRAHAASATSSSPTTSTFRSAVTPCAPAVLLEGANLASTFLRNGFGTFTFGNLEAYDARLASTYSVRQGDPTVDYAMWQFAWYVQDDIRVRTDLTVSLGLRHEWQTHLDDPWNFSPRAGFAWSPFKKGRPRFAAASACSTTGTKQTRTSRRCRSTVSGSATSSSRLRGSRTRGRAARPTCSRRASFDRPTA